MTDPGIAAKIEKKTNLIQWITNPFHYIAGMKAMLFGIMIIILSGFLAFLKNYRFDDLISFHMITDDISIWQGITDGIISWLIISILFLISGKIISKSRFRIIDVLGTQALARFPYLPLALIISIPGLMPACLRFTSDLLNIKNIKQVLSIDTAAFIFFIIFSLAMIIWMIMLMYRAFAVSCNAAGRKAIIAFIICLITGTILSSVVIKRIPVLKTGSNITAEETVNTEVKARNYVTLFTEDKFAEATGRFDDTMKSIISEQKIREIWTSSTSGFGQFKNLGSARYTRTGKYDVYDILCNFEKGWINCKVSFDELGKVAGLYFQ